jgi:hypothetical protein
MDFLSKQIGVKIMENFKIYVHHNYSYERFWYFFHGVDVDLKDVIVFTNIENAFNKKIPIKDKVNIKCKYKGNDLDITFVGDTDYDLKGHHIIDYSINLYDNDLASDRGFNSNIRNRVNKYFIPLLNEKSKIDGVIYHFMYIDWECHNAYHEHKMDGTLNKNVNVYVDEVTTEKGVNVNYTFTNTFMSFIYPNTLGLRDYYFFADILKYKNDYNHRVNYPIRRIYENKLRLFNSIMDLKDRNINVTHSSFHDTMHYSPYPKILRKKVVEMIGDGNFIQKRGYGIDDWGGEWNSNNLSEFMWKMFGIAEVNIIPEYSPNEVFKTAEEFEEKMVGVSYITEKSVSHILANKPFIPLSYETIDFYNGILKEYGFEPKKYPLEYEVLDDIIIELNDTIGNTDKWEVLKKELQEWNSHTRECILKIINSENSLLDKLINTKSKETISLL